MNWSITKTFIDIKPGTAPVRINASMYDNNSRLVVMTVKDGGRAFDMIGLSARVEGTRTDGTGFMSACTIGDGTVSFLITKEMTNSAGDQKAEIILFAPDNHRIGTANFIIRVEPAALDEDTEISPEDETLINQYITSLTEKIDEAMELVETAEQAAASAETSAGSAVRSADSAQHNALKAEQYASSAKDSADRAESTAGNVSAQAQRAESAAAQAAVSASNASASASEAGTSANRARNSMAQAAAYQAQADRSASDAQTYAAGANASRLAAESSRRQAAQSASSASSYANAAQSSAESALADAAHANTYAQNAASSATAAEASAEAAAASAEEAAETLAGKADTDGYYPDLYAGNLTTDKEQTDTAPYLFRPTAGGLQRIDDLCYPAIIGASVAENQLCNGESVTVTNGHKYYLKKSDTESLGASTGTAITGLTSGSDMVIDLTQKLGSSIADRAYTLEQQTAGSGLAWLRSYGFLTEEYKPYNTGSIESVEATAKVVRDENGENPVTYSLGSDVLRGIFKLDNGKLYADGDRKTADGVITRKYSVVTLDGSETWEARSGKQNEFYVIGATPDAVVLNASTQTSVNEIATSCGYRAMTWADYRASSADKVISFYYGQPWLIVRDSSFSTADALKTYLATHPMTVVYLKATPTTEQSTPFPSPEVCYPDGTEEFVTENGVPVGHETAYPYDLKALVEGLIDVPDVPSANGTYMLRATRSASGVSYAWTSV